MSERNQGAGRMPTFARATRWRGWVSAAYIAISLILLTALANILGTLYYGRLVARETSALRAEGKPLILSELTGAPVAPGDNAAPLYRQAAQIVSAPENGPKYGDRDWFTPSKLAVLMQRVDADSQALQLVVKATGKPACDFATDWAKGPAAHFPHYEERRELARFLRTAAITSAHRKDMAEALERLRMGGMLVNRALGEPALVGQLVAIAVDGVVLHALPYVIAQGPLPEQQVRDLSDCLDGKALHEGFLRSLQGERVVGLDFFGLVRASPQRAAQIADGALHPSPFTNGSLTVYTRLLGALVCADQLKYIRYMNGVEDSARLPWREAQPALQALEDSIGTKTIGGALTSIIAPVFQSVFAKTNSQVAGRELAKLAMGLELHKQRFGAYPEALAQLKRLDWPMPDDPFTGQAFIYRRQEEGFLLYSVGPDGQDDGGRPVRWIRNRHQPFHEPRSRKSTAGADEGGDILWSQWCEPTPADTS